MCDGHLEFIEGRHWVTGSLWGEAGLFTHLNTCWYSRAGAVLFDQAFENPGNGAMQKEEMGRENAHD